MHDFLRCPWHCREVLRLVQQSQGITLIVEAGFHQFSKMQRMIVGNCCVILQGDAPAFAVSNAQRAVGSMCLV